MAQQVIHIVIKLKSVKFIPLYILASCLWFTAPVAVNAQEINFGQFGNYTITLDNITMGDLVFESPVVSGGGIYQVELADAYVLSLEGVKYLDVGVTIMGEGELLLNGDPSNIGDPQKSIPFILSAAYANRGQNNISDAIFIPLSTGNDGNVRFPILSRQQQPPGPPPTPPTEAFDQSLVNENAYLYFYGQIDVGNVDAGTYSGTITITVEYE
jgi:spore coat protein U-like protein